MEQGDSRRAFEASAQARKYAIISIILGIMLVPVIIALIIMRAVIWNVNNDYNYN